MSETELQSGSAERQIQQFQEVESVFFDRIRRGSEFLVHIGQTPEITEKPDFAIKVTGIRKDGLQVQVNSGSEQFTARMPGGFRALRPDQMSPGDFTPGISPNIIKVANESEETCLYLENLKDSQTNEKISRSM